MTGQHATSMWPWERVLAIAGPVVMLALYVGVDGLHWLTGGVQPTQQVQVQQLTAQVAEAPAPRSRRCLTKKFDLMPQPRLEDAAAMNQELGGLTSRVDVLSSDVARQEGILSRLGLGTGTQVRDPRHQ